MKKNDLLQVKIETMGNAGEGIGKIDGYPLFVKDALPGDVAEVRLTKVKKTYAYARLERLLELEVWQVFYVDSTLKHDYAAMQAELEKFQKAKVSNYSMYVTVQDKWMETIDSTYRTIFTEEQWNAYLKSGAEKQQKARAKRKAKAEKALEKLESKGN